MPTIAMTREMGSRGREVAQRVADEMGLTLVLHEIVERDLAERLCVPERAVHNRLEGGAGWRERWQIGSKRLAHHTAEEVLELAQRGNVLIRGWGACVLLRDVPHVGRIRVCAPIELRERNVMERRGLKDKGAARREIEANDHAHEHILRVAFGVEREDAKLYDLVLNTGRVPVDTCVRLVRGLVESPEFDETEASRAVLGDKVLEAKIRLKLGERFTLGTGVGALRAAVAGGRVVLCGTALHSSLAHEAGRIVGEIPGVKDVDNRIEVVRGPRAL
jgi:cytidylate kinase